MPAGEFKWLTVVSPEGPDDLELVLEPNARPAANTYHKALLDEGIPATAFAADDIQKECERMEKLGVVFSQPPTKTGPATTAAFDDTVGNHTMLDQV